MCRTASIAQNRLLPVRRRCTATAVGVSAANHAAVSGLVAGVRRVPAKSLAGIRQVASGPLLPPGTCALPWRADQLHTKDRPRAWQWQYWVLGLGVAWVQGSAKATKLLKGFVRLRGGRSGLRLRVLRSG